MPFLSYDILRVFTRGKKNGNHLAVFQDSSSLTVKQMQAIAKKLGYSETSFVFAPSSQADYRVRFFTPEKELQFAGHPSIGTLYTLLKSNRLEKKKKRFIQQIGRRFIPLSLQPDSSILMDQGRPTFGKKTEAAETAKLLGLKESDIAGAPTVVSTGLPLLIVPLASLPALKKSAIRKKAYASVTANLKIAAVMPFTISRGAVRCRMFAPAVGITEDPATGSGAGPLAAYIARYGMMPLPPTGLTKLEVLQGVKPGGASLLKVRLYRKHRAVQRVEVGGFCKYLGRKKINLKGL